MICKRWDQVIIVSEKADTSTNKVMAFLQSSSIPTIRLGENIPIENLSIYVNSINIELNNYVNIIFTDNNANTSFWYRRSNFSFSQQNDNMFLNYLEKESTNIKEFLHKLEKRISLGSHDKEIKNNLILDLTNASQIGFVIPNTLLTTSKKALIKFSEVFNKIITKPLRNYPMFKQDNNYWSSKGAFLLKDSNISILSERFSPTLFQEYIEKTYEIRVFYLKGEIYSMAIFSQLDEKTKNDYRNYNQVKPNRNVPYQLPLEMEEKIRFFMERSGLDTGSLDIIRATDGRFVFLEVNPCGQFDWLSSRCNYYLEQKIAHYLAYGTID